MAQELSNAISGMASVLRDDELRDSVASFADKRLRETDLSPLLARVLDAVCDAGQHQAALTAVLRGSRTFLEQNRAVFRQRVAEESPEWVPEWVDDRVFAKGYTLLQRFLADVIDDDDHALRRGFDTQLRDLARRLRERPRAAGPGRDREAAAARSPERARLPRQPVEHAQAARPRRRGRPRLGPAPVGGGARGARWRGAARRPGDQAKVDEALQRLTGHVVDALRRRPHRASSPPPSRAGTPQETSRRLELQVGRDLQFIRINGTVVGALAGLAIYAISQLF